MQTLEEIISRWDSGEGKPYKGELIDWDRYSGDGEEPPADIGCMCAQGQILHLLGGWTPNRLKAEKQRKADLETSHLLNISISHAILLRHINDTIDGAPSIVLTHPEKILGDQAEIILAFWHHLDRMEMKDWNAVITAADAAGNAVGNATYASWDVIENIIWIVAMDAVGYAASYAAVYAAYEIQGALIMREQKQQFLFS